MTKKNHNIITYIFIYKISIDFSGERQLIKTLKFDIISKILGNIAIS